MQFVLKYENPESKIQFLISDAIFFSYIVNLKLDTVQESNWNEFKILINFLTINPISGLIGQIYWWIMDLFTKIVGLTRILLEKIGVANIHILSRPHVLVEVPVQFRAMRPGEITHMPLLGMAIPVVEFSREGYKIRKVLG